MGACIDNRECKSKDKIVGRKCCNNYGQDVVEDQFTCKVAKTLKKSLTWQSKGSSTFALTKTSSSSKNASNHHLNKASQVCQEVWSGAEGRV